MAMINRRDALKRIGGLAGAATLGKFLSACGDNGGDEGPVGITTYVYVMLENRTYDHVFGARSMLEGKPGNGLSMDMRNPDVNGNLIAPYEPSSMADQLCVAADPPHGWRASNNQWNAGANDGFVKAQQADYPGSTDPMQYLTRKQQPVSWALADAYTTCDRWHAGIMGPTLPNRFYWHAATSCGYRSNQILEDVTKVGVPTIYHRLRDANVEWNYYYSSLPVVAALGNLKAPYNLPSDYVGPRVKRFGDSEHGEGQFFTDAAEGKLAPVNYIDPFFYLNDDHPPSHPLMAQQLIAAIYTALANSPQWKNCMLVVTYDEHGGFFDHVSPGTTADDTAQNFPTDEDGNPTTAYTDPDTGKTIHGFDQLGFRVPAIVAGPYVKQGHVSNVEYNHASALKHLGNAFGLPDLNARMAAANDLTDCIDMERLAAGDWAKPVELPEILINYNGTQRVSITSEGVDYPWDETCELQGASLRTADPISQIADRSPEIFAGYADLRPSHQEYVASLDRFLRKHRR